jgi:fructokinase
MNDVIAVIGEALVDLVAASDGTLAVKPGGGPYNTARTIGRLGVQASFLDRVSDDAFGRLLRAGLAESGVTLGISDLTAAPTSLAVASITVGGGAPEGGASEGSAEYRFYLAGTSTAAVEYSDLAAAIPKDVAAVYAGSFALILEPAATSLERLLLAGLSPAREGPASPSPSPDSASPDSPSPFAQPADTPSGDAPSLEALPLTSAALVMIDPNCRPAIITDRDAYLARLARIFRRADIVKASTEDLDYLYPGQPADAAARELLAAGPVLVLVTDGPRPARAFLAGSPAGPAREIATPIPPVTVVDTIGAGDAFGGAFLAWWTRDSLTRADLANPDLVATALRAAAEVASLTCTRPGADPPRLADVHWPRR